MNHFSIIILILNVRLSVLRKMKWSLYKSLLREPHCSWKVGEQRKFIIQQLLYICEKNVIKSIFRDVLLLLHLQCKVWTALILVFLSFLLLLFFVLFVILCVRALMASLVLTAKPFVWTQMRCGDASELPIGKNEVQRKNKWKFPAVPSHSLPPPCVAPPHLHSLSQVVHVVKLHPPPNPTPPPTPGYEASWLE